MDWFSNITSLLDKFIPSRKAAAVDQLNNLTAEYQKALAENNDTLAASLRVQLVALRKKLGFTDGDI